METPDSKNIDYQQGTVSAVDLHDAVRRETPLHPGERGTVGVSVLVISALILIFGGGHLFSTSNGFSSGIYTSSNYVPRRAQALLAAPKTPSRLPGSTGG